MIYIGSFPKSLLPSLRFGFLVALPSLRQALRTARCLTDWHTSLPSQRALARFIDERKLARHVRRMRSIYQARRQRIIDGLNRDFAGVLAPIPSAVGLHLSTICTGRTFPETLAWTRRARPQGVFLYTLSQFAVGSAEAGMIIGYGAVPLDRIDEGLHRLRTCLDEPVSRSA